MVSNNERLLLFSGVDDEAPFIITHYNHKMVLLVNPEPFIDQNDEGTVGIDILLQILPAARILGGVQSLFLGIEKHIHIQGAPGLFAEDLGSDFRRRYF